MFSISITQVECGAIRLDDLGKEFDTEKNVRKSVEKHYGVAKLLFPF